MEPNLFNSFSRGQNLFGRSRIWLRQWNVLARGGEGKYTHGWYASVSERERAVRSWEWPTSVYGVAGLIRARIHDPRSARACVEQSHCLSGALHQFQIHHTGQPLAWLLGWLPTRPPITLINSRPVQAPWLKIQPLINYRTCGLLVSLSRPGVNRLHCNFTCFISTLLSPYCVELIKILIMNLQSWFALSIMIFRFFTQV